MTVLRSRSIFLFVFVMTAAGLACNKPLASDAGARRKAFAGIRCNAVPESTGPELMAWDARSRAELARLRRQSVVAVRYEANGCDVTLELLPQCVGPKNRYVYSPFNDKGTRLARDAAELLSQLPVGAANVAGRLDGNHALRTDFQLVGSAALPEGSTITQYDLVGPECKLATHVISAVYVGGFAMTTPDAGRANAMGNLFEKPSSASGEPIAREGYAPICERAAKEGIELEGCSVPLRVELLPLDSKAPPLRCTSGFTFDGTRCVAGTVPIAKGTASGTVCEGHDAGAGCSAPRVALPTPTAFDQAAVERVVRQHQAGVKRVCWEPETARLKRVTVSVRTKVDPKGKVAEADAQVVDVDGPADVASVVGRCIANEVRAWQFPEPDSEKVLTLPFVLIRQ